MGTDGAGGAGWRAPRHPVAVTMAGWLKRLTRPTWIELLGLVAVVAGVSMMWLALGITIGGILLVLIAQGLRRDDSAA